MTTLQVYAHRLSDPNLSKKKKKKWNRRQHVTSILTHCYLAPALKVTIANELRDQVEVFQTLEYSRFLATLIPVFVDILQNGNPVFQSNVPEQVRQEQIKHINSLVLTWSCIEIAQHYIGNHLSIATDRNLERICT